MVANPPRPSFNATVTPNVPVFVGVPVTAPPLLERPAGNGTIFQM
jgi:hypothetical protein